MNLKSVKKIAIIGVGFMGGSLALAMKRKFANISIWGYARSQKSYNKLKKLKILDKATLNLEKCVLNADIVILALPVEAVIACLEEIAPLLRKNSIVFDLGSTKKLIEKAALSYLPKEVSFVGCHPLCGSEKSGAEFARWDTYKNSICLIASSAKEKAAKIIEQFWKKLGSKVIFMSSGSHDELLSSISHFPHLISFSLIQLTPDNYLKFCSGSFKDLTRISSSPASIWADIFFSNKKNLINDIDGFVKVLSKFKEFLEKGNKRDVFNLIKKANTKHMSIK